MYDFILDINKSSVQLSRWPLFGAPNPTSGSSLDPTGGFDPCYPPPKLLDPPWSGPHTITPLTPCLLPKPAGGWPTRFDVLPYSCTVTDLLKPWFNLMFNDDKWTVYVVHSYRRCTHCNVLLSHTSKWRPAYHVILVWRHRDSRWPTMWGSCMMNRPSVQLCCIAGALLLLREWGPRFTLGGGARTPIVCEEPSF